MLSEPIPSDAAKFEGQHLSIIISIILEILFGSDGVFSLVGDWDPLLPRLFLVGDATLFLGAADLF
jgi:hypothetical protein